METALAPRAVAARWVVTCTHAAPGPLSRNRIPSNGIEGATNIKGAAAAVFAAYTAPCMAQAPQRSLPRAMRRRALARSRRVRLSAAAKEGAEASRNVVEAEVVTDKDLQLIKDAVLQQALQGRILSPWESLFFHVRASRGFAAFRSLRARLWDWLPLQNRTEVVASKAAASEADNSLPEQAATPLGGSSPAKVAMLGTRSCSFHHQQEIETLSHARIMNGEHIYTSGSVGTNAAVIRGGLKAGRPELLTVILPQSLSKQDEESQKLLHACHEAGVEVIPTSSNDDLPLAQAARLCNRDVLGRVEKLVSFVSLVPAKSERYMSLIAEAKEKGIVAAVFYLD